MALIDLNKLMIAAHEDLKAGKIEDCLTKTLYLLDQKPDHYFPLYLLGSYFSKIGHHGTSILAYEKAILLYPDFSEAHNNVGGSYRKLNMQKKAVAAFSRAIEIGNTEKFKKDTEEKCTQLLNYIAKNAYSLTLAVSLGHIRTLIEKPGSMTHSMIPKESQEEAKIDKSGTRMSVGIEKAEDIIADFEDALKHI